MKPVANGEHGTLPHEEKRNPWGKSRNQHTDSILLALFFCLCPSLWYVSSAAPTPPVIPLFLSPCISSFSTILFSIIHAVRGPNDCLSWQTAFRFFPFFHSRINCSLTPRAGICWEWLDLFDVGKGSGLYCVLMLTMCERDRLQRNEREMTGPRSALTVRALGWIWSHRLHPGSTGLSACCISPLWNVYCFFFLNPISS